MFQPRYKRTQILCKPPYERLFLTSSKLSEGLPDKATTDVCSASWIPSIQTMFCVV